MRNPATAQQLEIQSVIHAAVASAMSDFAALLIAYSMEGPITEDILVHVQAQVITTLKNASVTGMPLELQAVTISHAVEEVSSLMSSAIRRGASAQRSG
ncbi:MAG: hypothetical protein JSS43_08255 [Proteobacteria bacterium]|nr:hypothetical protein [Pseudomonadota bacterium]